MQHPLDVAATIDARSARGLRDTQVRELRFPRAQHVGLDLCDLADLRLPEQRAVRDLHCGNGHLERVASISEAITALDSVNHHETPQAFGFLRADVLPDLLDELFARLPRAILLELVQHPVADPGDAQDV